MCCSCVFFFCFKQKTAYEMRISDWNSDVCSSDLPAAPMVVLNQLADGSVNLIGRVWLARGDYWDVFFEGQEKIKENLEANGISLFFPRQEEIGRAECRERVCQYV